MLTLLIASCMVAALDVSGVREEPDRKHFTMSEADPMITRPHLNVSLEQQSPPWHWPHHSLQQTASRVAAAVDQDMVWKLGMAELRRVLAFFFALLLEFVLWYFLFKNQKRSTYTVPPTAEMTGDFQPVGLFACFSMQAKAILEWVCCFGFMWSDTAIGSGAIAENDLLRLVAGLVFLDFLGVGFFVMLLEVEMDAATASILFDLYELCTSVILFYFVFKIRRAMREKQPGGNDNVSAATDVGLVVCCCPCTAQQQTQYQEISTLEKMPNLVEAPKEEEKAPAQSTLEEKPALEPEKAEAPTPEEEKPEAPLLEKE